MTKTLSIIKRAARIAESGSRLPMDFPISAKKTLVEEDDKDKTKASFISEDGKLVGKITLKD